MTERERLIELLRQRSCFHTDCNGHCMECCGRYFLLEDDDIKTLADHLLANGVVVPPVNVGQTVYIIDEGDGECAEDYVLDVEVLGLFINKHGIAVDLKLPLGFRLNTWAVIGKNVFLTREEAEKAPSERIKTDCTKCRHMVGCEPDMMAYHKNPCDLYEERKD